MPLTRCIVASRNSVSRIIEKVVVSDTFTDSDGTLLEAHTPDIDDVGLGWTVQRGDPAEFKIDNNELLINLNNLTNTDQATIDAGISDCVITLTMELGGVNPVFWFRVNGDVGNAPEHGFTVNMGISASLFRLSRVEGVTNQTLLDSAGHLYAVGEIVDLRITLNGDSIIAEDLTHGLTLSATDSFNQNETEYGPGENSGGFLCRMDNLIIKEVIFRDQITRPDSSAIIVCP